MQVSELVLPSDATQDILPPLHPERRLKTADQWTEQLIKENEHLICAIHDDLLDERCASTEATAKLKLNLTRLSAIFSIYYGPYLAFAQKNTKETVTTPETDCDPPSSEESQDNNRSQGIADFEDEVIESSAPSNCRYQRWTEDEINRLREGVRLYGNDMKLIAKHVRTRSVRQVTTKWARERERMHNTTN